MSFGGVGNDPKRGMSGAMEMWQYFAEVIEERRAEPRDDLISLLVSDDGGEGEEPLGTGELIMFCVLLLLAGNETTGRLAMPLLPREAPPQPCRSSAMTRKPQPTVRLTISLGQSASNRGSRPMRRHGSAAALCPSSRVRARPGTRIHLARRWSSPPAAAGCGARAAPSRKSGPATWSGFRRMSATGTAPRQVRP